MLDETGLDPGELARRLRRLSRNLPELARRSGLTEETVRQVLDGNIVNLTPSIRERLLRALVADA